MVRIITVIIIIIIDYQLELGIEHNVFLGNIN